MTTQPAGAVLDAPAPTPIASAAAAALAARIQIPRRLPVRYDGQPIRHLSNSSYTRFVACSGSLPRYCGSSPSGRAQRSADLCRPC